MNILIKYKNWLKGGCFLFLFLSSLMIVKNNLQYNITSSHADEVHTLNFGIHSIYSKKVTTLRVGETTRWLARAIYPVALYYMNSNMGGEHYVTGWEYAGGDYVKKYYHLPDSIKGNPNLQDFTFAMKFVLGFLVLSSLLLGAFMLFRTYGFITGVFYFVFTISATLFNEMLSIFYTESSLIILLNLILTLALCEKNNKWRFYFWAALILAFSISTKLTGVVFIIPIVVILTTKDNVLTGLKLEITTIITIVLLVVIHMYAPSYSEVENQTLANVYHLKTGHYVTEASGFNQVKNISSVLSLWLFALPISIFVIFYKKPKYSPFLLSISIASLIMIVALVGVSFFLKRNLTTPLVMIILISSVAFSELIKSIPFKPQLVLGGVLLGLFFLQANNVIRNKKVVDANLIRSYIKTPDKIASVDLEEHLISNYTLVKGTPETFVMKEDQKKFRALFEPFSYVVIKRKNNNKHYTNYILPMDFDLIARHGNYFIYKKSVKEEKVEEKQMEVIIEGIESPKELENYILQDTAYYNTYVKDDSIAFHRKNCTPEELSPTFILHIFPENIKFLSAKNQEIGIENLDFVANPNSFSSLNGCIVKAGLPNYPIKQIEVGQLDKNWKILWKRMVQTKN